MLSRLLMCTSCLRGPALRLELDRAETGGANDSWQWGDCMLQVAGASVHWYGKAEVALQRKIGHVTITAPDRGTALERLSAVDSAAAAALSTSTGRPSPCVRASSAVMIEHHQAVSRSTQASQSECSAIPAPLHAMLGFGLSGTICTQCCCMQMGQMKARQLPRLELSWAQTRIWPP